jgi:hypothetical protein
VPWLVATRFEADVSCPARIEVADSQNAVAVPGHSGMPSMYIDCLQLENLGWYCPPRQLSQEVKSLGLSRALDLLLHVKEVLGLSSFNCFVP